jgi:hypothetical protein
MFTHILGKSKKSSLYSNHTDWNCFRETIDEQITLEIPVKTEIGIEEAVESITKAIQHAAWQATPNRNEQNSKEECPIIVKQKIAKKERKARKRWQLTRAPRDKQRYNKLAKELKNLFHSQK